MTPAMHVRILFVSWAIFANAITLGPRDQIAWSPPAIIAGEIIRAAAQFLQH
jgi:hypothetical protein